VAASIAKTNIVKNARLRFSPIIFARLLRSKGLTSNFSQQRAQIISFSGGRAGLIQPNIFPCRKNSISGVSKRWPSRIQRVDSRYQKETAMSIRPVKRLIKSKPTTEGAGVHLRRAFGFGNTSDFDPFLLLDDFRNDVRGLSAGFPWHPHRGIETITYVLAGTVEHGDSMGNKGAIAAGDVQWMTAGSGIIHQEMPRRRGRADAWFPVVANLRQS